MRWLQAYMSVQTITIRSAYLYDFIPFPLRFKHKFPSVEQGICLVSRLLLVGIVNQGHGRGETFLSGLQRRVKRL